MLAEERYGKILEILSNEKTVKSSYLIQLLNVSTETVRRDLESLEKNGLIKRVHGGAVLNNGSSLIPSFSTRNDMKNEEKDLLAKNAIPFISNGNSIALDNGTTTLHLATLIKGNYKDLTVITNSLLIANMLYEDPHINVILLGGIIDSKSHCMTGPLTEKNIELFHIDKAFISVTGISLNNGATDFEFNSIGIQKKLISRSNKIYLLADSSKFNTSSLLKICDLEDVDSIITDPNLSDAVYKEYSDAGIHVIK